MPRMSKKRKREWSFFLNDKNRISYNTLCRKCTNDCKQSFRAAVIVCPRYCSKRSARLQSHAALARPPTNNPSYFQFP